MIIQKAENNDHSLIANRNANAKNRKEAAKGHNKGGQIKNGSININELGGKMDSILMRRQQAQKKAMKVVGDAWKADKKIDLDLKERGTRIQELKSVVDENMEMLNNCNASMEELKETYNIEEDSQEQKDLELVRLWKQNSAVASMSKMLDSKEVWDESVDVSLTDEEWKRMMELGGKLDNPTEYQRRALEIDSETSFFQKNIDDAQDEINAENGAIRAIKLERLKDHSMVDAQKEAEQINADASKDIIGMLIGEAKDHIDEELAEKIEDAKEKAEEKEEQEEKLEEQKEEKEEQGIELELKQEENKEAKEIQNEQRQKAREQADLLEEVEGNIILPSSNAAEAQAEIREMLQRMKLLEEDLKGMKVDKKIED
ncbi:MAG: hypothetical protein NC321_12190 [Clostridium sp.]|nr:hypothetical protein [Clostridium sp.]